MQACFVLYFNLRSVKSYKYSYQFIYFILFYISFNISRYQFSRLFRLHLTLSEKDFRRKFSFLNRFTQLHTLMAKICLSVTFFLSIFSKIPSKTVFSSLFTKFCKSIFYVSAKNYHSHWPGRKLGNPENHGNHGKSI